MVLQAVVWLVTGFVAGLLGSLLGIGGGMLIVPLLLLLGNVPIKHAIMTSLASVTATSAVSTVFYVRKGLVNTWLASCLLPTVILGSFLGAHTALSLPEKVLRAAFGFLLLCVAALMLRGKDQHGDESGKKSQEAVGSKLRILLLALMCVAVGFFSGLLGVGGGFLLVPLMTIILGMPLKESIATSLLIVGGAGSTGATIYYQSGLFNPIVTSTVIIGVTLGASIGSAIMVRTRARVLRILFVAVLVYLALRMLWGAVLS